MSQIAQNQLETITDRSATTDPVTCPVKRLTRSYGSSQLVVDLMIRLRSARLMGQYIPSGPAAHQKDQR
jgi:hypothetical protein